MRSLPTLLDLWGRNQEGDDCNECVATAKVSVWHGFTETAGSYFCFWWRIAQNSRFHFIFYLCKNIVYQCKIMISWCSLHSAVRNLYLLLSSWENENWHQFSVLYKIPWFTFICPVLSCRQWININVEIWLLNKSILRNF